MKLHKQNIKGVKYKDGASIKFKNRRVIVFEDGGGYTLSFRAARDKPGTCHEYLRLKDKVDVNTIKITTEGAEALLICLCEQLGYELFKK